VNREACIFVAGGRTLAGAAILDRLRETGHHNLVGTPPDEPDLTVAAQVDDFFGESRPEYVFLVAGRSGGIQLNRTRPAELMLDNLLVTAHVVDSAWRHGVKKLLYLASSCSYPKQAPQPMRVDSLMTGPLEPTNAAYAMAKLAGWQLCAAYRRQHGACFVTAVPANAFGPHDDFGCDTGHVIPSLMRRAHEAKLRGDRELTIWGTGAPRREFIYARDLADACLLVMRHYGAPAPINLGVGSELSIAEIARAIANVVGFRGRLLFDAQRPDGMPRKILDSSDLHALGWHQATDLQMALAETYHWFQQHVVTEDPEHARAVV
jgi:GDP-L-fucose synthase